MYLKDILGSIVRVGDCIPVLDFYLVLNDFRCQKSTLINKSIKRIVSPINDEVITYLGDFFQILSDVFLIFFMNIKLISMEL